MKSTVTTTEAQATQPTKTATQSGTGIVGCCTVTYFWTGIGQTIQQIIHGTAFSKEASEAEASPQAVCKTFYGFHEGFQRT